MCRELKKMLYHIALHKNIWKIQRVSEINI